MEDAERLQIIAEYRPEVLQMIEQMKVRVQILCAQGRISDEKEAFSPAMVMSGLSYAGLHYALNNGLTPAQFIAAIRAMANQLEVEWTTKSGMFAEPRHA
jgi:hypothetical protein